jgi:hypothetical protein
MSKRSIHHCWGTCSLGALQRECNHLTSSNHASWLANVSHGGSLGVQCHQLFGSPNWFPSPQHCWRKHFRLSDVLSEEKRMSYLGAWTQHESWQFNPVKSKHSQVRPKFLTWTTGTGTNWCILNHHRHLLMRTPPCPTMPQSQKYPKRLEASWCQKMTDIDWSWVGPLVSVSDVSVGTGTPLVRGVHCPSKYQQHIVYLVKVPNFEAWRYQNQKFALWRMCRNILYCHNMRGMKICLPFWCLPGYQ